MEIISRKVAKAAGLIHYFTGKKCIRGHLSKRIVSGYGCCSCQTENARNWRCLNRSKQKENKIKWEKKNPEKVKELNKKIYVRNHEKIRLRARAAYARNPEKYILSAAVWATKNIEKVRSIRRNRKARNRNAEGSHTAFDVAIIRKAQKDRCAYCQIPLKCSGHLDHIFPLILGGSNWPNNLQWLCESCNLRKHATDPIEFARKLGRLL